LKVVASLRLLPVAFVAAACAHDARFTGTWYRPIPLLLRLEPGGAASFGASPEQARGRRLTGGTWAASDGQILVVFPSECPGAPTARGGFFSLRFIDGAPPRLRVELVSRGQCQAFDGMVAEEYVAAPDSRASARSPVGDWRKVDTHIAQGAVASFKDDGRYAILLPRHTQEGTSQGIGYQAVTAGRWSSHGDVIELADGHLVSCATPSRTSRPHLLAEVGAQRMTWRPLPDTCEAVRDLAGPGWTRVPDLADGTDSRSGAAPDSPPVIGRWRIPLDPLVRLAPDGGFAVSLTASGLERVMEGSWQPRAGAEAGVQMRSWRGGCAVEPTLVTEVTLASRATGTLTPASWVGGCERFAPLRGLELRELVRVSSGRGDVGSPWDRDWRPRAAPFWIVAFFANGQYAMALPVRDESRILAFGTWSLAGDRLALHEQAGYCQRSPGDGDGSYSVDLGAAAGPQPTLLLRRRDDTCTVRAPLDGARASPWAPDADHPLHDATFDGQ